MKSHGERWRVRCLLNGAHPWSGSRYRSSSGCLLCLEHLRDPFPAAERVLLPVPQNKEELLDAQGGPEPGSQVPSGKRAPFTSGGQGALLSALSPSPSLPALFSPFMSLPAFSPTLSPSPDHSSSRRHGVCLFSPQAGHEGNTPRRPDYVAVLGELPVSLEKWMNPS